MEKERKTGLVLEGGGMRGIYTAGVLDVFLDCLLYTSRATVRNLTLLWRVRRIPLRQMKARRRKVPPHRTKVQERKARQRRRKAWRQKAAPLRKKVRKQKVRIRRKKARKQKRQKERKAVQAVSYTHLTHRQLSDEQLVEAGVDPSMIRLSRCV